MKHKFGSALRPESRRALDEIERERTRQLEDLIEEADQELLARTQTPDATDTSGKTTDWSVAEAVLKGEELPAPSQSKETDWSLAESIFNKNDPEP